MLKACPFGPGACATTQLRRGIGRQDGLDWPVREQHLRLRLAVDLDCIERELSSGMRGSRWPRTSRVPTGSMAG